MLVRSQDKEILADVNEFSTIKVFGDEARKVCIMGKVVNTTDEIPLGFYSSIEEATEELGKIVKQLSKRLNNIYQIN